MTRWKDDLIVGNEGQKFTLEKLRVQLPQAYQKEGYCKEYDIIDPKSGITLEVKTDKVSLKTKRLFIETSCNGNPSGIITTTSDYWVQYNGEEYFLFNSEVLLYYIKTANLIEKKGVIPPGNTIPVDGSLLPKEEAKTICNYHCNVDENMFKKIKLTKTTKKPY